MCWTLAEAKMYTIKLDAKKWRILNGIIFISISGIMILSLSLLPHLLKWMNNNFKPAFYTLYHWVYTPWTYAPLSTVNLRIFHDWKLKRPAGIKKRITSQANHLKQEKKQTEKVKIMTKQHTSISTFQKYIYLKFSFHFWLVGWFFFLSLLFVFKCAYNTM